MRRFCENHPKVTRHRILPLVALAWLGLAAGSALAQPTNDNFVNAQDLGTAGSGSVTGSNVNATEETGEQFIFGVPGGQSVWYKWTAPADGPVTFSTVGSGFDSLLGVYVGPSVDNLTLINEGYDLISFGFTLPVTFVATAGQTYDISVDGYLFGIPQGNLVLTWTTNNTSAMAAGDFKFTAATYMVSEEESGFFPISANMGYVGPRLTVTRTGGSAGRVLVDYNVTNAFYTNFVFYTISGTNVTTVTNLNGTPISTNISYISNIVAQWYYQDDQWGVIGYLNPYWNWTNYTGVVINGTNFVTSTTNAEFLQTNPNFPCLNQNLGSSIDTNASPITVTYTTNVFCNLFVTNQIVNSAEPYQDYIPTSGTLTFDDFQMSQDILVTVFPNAATGNTNLTVVNRSVFAQITGIRLDPLETTAISPPTTNSTLTTALLNILDTDTSVGWNPVDQAENTGQGFGTAHVAANVINFGSATIRCTESVAGTGTAVVWVERHGVDNTSPTVQYRIDYYSPTANRNDAFRNGAEWEMPLQAGSDYATPQGSYTYSANVDFLPVSGQLSWGAFDGNPKPIVFPVNDDNLVEFNEDVLLQLWEPEGYTGASVGYVRTCNLTILFDDQPAGSLDRTFNPDNDANTSPPYNLHPGPNNTVYNMAIQPDGKTIIGGDFTAYNTVPRNRVARINVDGSLDTGFDPADGADAFVSAITLDSSGKIILGGAFSSINRISRNRIARLNTDGSLDTTFTPGLGANGTVWSIGFHTNGTIYVAGEFTTMNTTNRNRIARLNPDGSLDNTFDPGVGPDGNILSINVQPDTKVIIAGEFSSVDGVACGHIARLNSDGTLDTSFNIGQGFNDVVFSTALQPDGKVVVGGAFTAFQQYNVSRLTRLNANGTLDLNFVTGDGADDDVYAVALQTDGTILAGGIFKSFNQNRRVGLTRLLTTGLVDTSFMDTAYNQFAGIPTHYFDPGVEPPNYIYQIAIQPSGNVLIAGNFPRVGGGTARDDIRNRANFARLIGGSTPGPGNIELAYDSYTADQNGQSLFITMNRINGSLGQAAVSIRPDPLPSGPGAAVDGQDYSFNLTTYGTPTWITTWADGGGGGTWQFIDAEFGHNNGFEPTVDPNLQQNDTGAPLNNDVFITIIDNTNSPGNKSLNLKLSNPTGTDLNLLGGENIPCGVALGRSAASLTIIDPHTLPGVLSFSSPTYSVSESSNAVITVTRTNGVTGLVSVQYATANGTATNFIHYLPSSGRLTFNPGDTVKSFTITNIDESIKEGDHTVLLRLFNPSVASLGLSNAVLTIIDNDIVGGYVEFPSATFATNENAGLATVTVNRQGGGAGTLMVQVAVTNGTAVNGVNFTAFTNTLTWVNNDVQAKTVTIPIFDDGIVNPTNLTINLRLFGATLNGTNNLFGIGNTNTAVLTLINSDFRGAVGFSAANYRVNENGGPGYVTVVRSGGSAETISVNFAANTGTASAGTDYTPTNGTLVFGPGQLSKTILIPIIDNSVQNPPRDINLVLSGATPAGTLGSISNSTLSIIDDETYNEPPGAPDTTFNPSTDDAIHTMALQSDAKILVGGDFNNADGISRHRMARFNSDGSLDTTFSSTSTTAGANDSILTIVQQTDRRILLGGRFTQINSVNRFYVARINLSGSIDSTFNPGSGTDNTVFAIGEAFDASGNRKVLIGGAFATFNSITQPYLARLNDNGNLDTTFNVGIGPNGTVYAVAVQADGKAVIGGDFTAVNGIARNHIARLNADGSVDSSFNPGSGADNSVRALAVQLDGRILLGGLFTNFNSVARSRIARLNANGSVDASFNPGLGANDAISTITVQPDTRIVVGGQFTRFNGVTRNRLTRLNNDGSQDTMINFGSGCDNYVDATLVQTNGMIVFAGGFTQYDGAPHAHIARIYGGTIGGAGQLEFTLADYPVLENGSNVVMTVRRRGGTTGAGSVTAVTSDLTATANTNYVPVSTNLSFPAGEVFASLAVPIIEDFVITPDLMFQVNLTNPLPSGGPVLGNQPFAYVTISNIDSGISFTSPNYVRNEDAIDGQATITLNRVGSTILPASVTFNTLTNGTAVPYTNYIPVTNLVVPFAAGQSSNFVQVPVLHDPRVTGDKSVPLQLSNPNNSLLFNPSAATLTIVDVDSAPGQFVLSQATNSVNENGGFITISVLRTNGHSGAVSVNFTTVNGSAIAGSRYVATNGFLSFADGETIKTFNVAIINDNIVTGNQDFTVVLSNPLGGATLGSLSVEDVTIIEDDVGVSFASSLYVVSENTSNLTLTVLRPYGTNNITHISFATTNGSGANGAIAGVNYVSANGNLTFNPGETFKTVTLTILHDTNVTGNLVFGVNLFTNQLSSSVTPIFPSFASVLILDAEAGISFTTNSTGVMEDGTNVVLTVVCSNPSVEPISVNYSTADGTSDNPGFAGVDYVPVSGTLSFTNGITTNLIVVPIIDNLKVDGDRDFSVNLSGPSSPGKLISPSSETIVITNNDAGLSFSSAAYDVFKNGVAANITVIRTGYTNTTVSVGYLTQDGSGPNGATNGVDYVATSGTLTFTNGQISTNFSVTVIDSTVIKPNRTLNLLLTNVVGNGSLQVPSAASLTIHDNSGSLIVPAGSLLTSENMTQNNVIEPGETVSLLLALRNAGGTNTGNMVATLLATNGITAPSGAQSYGSLVVDGPSASRSFSFTASGTNGQTITVTLALQDGSINRGTALFSYVLGTSSSSASTNGLITINDNTNATPYPSTINVSGVVGTISKATVTLSNITHFFPADIGALVLSPTGQKLLLMANSGSAPLTNVSLTFDDSAANALPVSGQITNGTYRPNGVSLVTTFPPPAPPAPYATNLSTFNNNSPNGVWSLFVLDDSPGYAGIISNGWSLKFSTLNTVASAADVVTTVGVATTTTVSNLVYRVNIGYNITVANYGPATATNVSVVDAFPTNATFVSASIGGYTLVSNVLTFTNIGSIAKDGSTSFNVTVSVPAVAGIVSNTVTALAAAPADPNLADNTVTSYTTIVNPTADVSVTLSGSPNPILLGDVVQYSLVVSNNINFAPAANVKLTNVLSLVPPVALLSNSPSSVALNANFMTFNLGVIPIGGKTNINIWVRPLSPGNVTNFASVGSALIDPFKVNNSASVKTLVEQFSATASGKNIVLSWPTDVGNYVVLTTTNLIAPNWTLVTNQPQSVIPGYYSVTLGTTNKIRFFRLQKQ
jgi:uncharacterized delta-60 repeat protein/uncharacterized repeat protein (TIGR01451 family)